MDKTSLESAIREKAQQAIQSIMQKEADEIKKLDDAYSAEMDYSKNRLQIQTDARISQESSKAKSRISLDLKKLKLRTIEAFISRTVEEAVQAIRENVQYKRFLLDAIVDAVGRVPSKAEIRLRSEDLGFENEIREALKVAGENKDIVVLEDNRIKWGGCIIIDLSGGRIFDSTIERLYFRKSQLIRREVMSLLANLPGESA